MASDRWLSSAEAAEHFGLHRRKDGTPNRRGFLERMAAMPGFPPPLVINGEKRWKLSEMEEWADEQRRVRRVA